jgi:CubicO group peptidase (beta-lactamase class C family)
MRLLFSLLLAGIIVAPAADRYPEARFTDPDRRQKLETAFPELDRIFEQYAERLHIPGMVWGVVIDGKLAHVKSTGVRDRASNAPVTAATVFRIASMTKSFTTLAILKLRDHGKLSLEDPVSKWIPEFARMQMPTRDTAPIRIRQLLSHGAGFPEDNPWGDQQLGVTDDQLTHWLQQGLPFSTAPDTAYEYSNYGFALLGRIVSKAAGMPYREYLKKEILTPLGMTDSTLDASGVEATARAVGYRRLPDGTYSEEEPLGHGAFGSMGGLLTTAQDLGRYVAFQLSAWPPRDDAEAGPVRRSSVREMNHMWRPSSLTAEPGPNGDVRAEVSGYGYGLRISKDCRFGHIVGHGGGLPGFGSYMAWLPEYGVGMFAMANLTYAGPAAPIGQGWDVLLKTGGLQKRELPASPMLSQTRDAIAKLWRQWDEKDAAKLAAINLFLDTPALVRREQMEKLKAEVGECAEPGPVHPSNWLRGRFDMKCQRGDVAVVFTLAPTQPPAVQYLTFGRASAILPKTGCSE